MATITNLCKLSKYTEVMNMLNTYPMNYRLDIPDKQFNATPLIWACWHSREGEALKFLEYPDRCNIDVIDSYNGTALMWACRHRMEKVALKLLNYADKCNLEIVNKFGETTLIVACVAGLKKVVQKILQTSEKCNISHLYINKISASDIAKEYGWTDIVNHIEKICHPSIMNLSPPHKFVLEV